MTPLLSFTIQAGPHRRRDCPLGVPLPPGVAASTNLYMIREDTDGHVPAQISRGDDGPLLCWIEPLIEANSSATYSVQEGPAPSGRVTLSETKKGVLEVHSGGDLVTAYHHGAQVARPFLFPLYGPGQRQVTRPVDLVQQEGEIDHIHHRGVWVAHGDVNGTDNWSEEPGHGRTVHQGFIVREEGPVHARFVAVGQWVSAAGLPLLDEQRQITVYRSLEDGRRLLDLDLTLRAADSPVRFGDTKEGGLLSVRVGPSMTGQQGGLIENAYGALTEEETWGRPAHWCDYSGAAGDDGTAILGIAVLDHPLNPRHPTHWHVRDYGLMTANPFGLSAFYEDAGRDGSLNLPAGQSLRFRYRLVVHGGRALEGAVREAYLNYCVPPRIAP